MSLPLFKWSSEFPRISACETLKGDGINKVRTMFAFSVLQCCDRREQGESEASRRESVAYFMSSINGAGRGKFSEGFGVWRRKW